MLFGSQCDCRHQLEKTAASYITTLLVLEHLFLPFCKNIKMHSCILLVECTFQLSLNHHLCSGGWIAWFGHWQRCHPVSLGRYFRLHLLCLPAIKEYSLELYLISQLPRRSLEGGKDSSYGLGAAFHKRT